MRASLFRSFLPKRAAKDLSRLAFNFFSNFSFFSWGSEGFWGRLPSRVWISSRWPMERSSHFLKSMLVRLPPFFYSG
jgi:hypothetical protein